MLRVRVCAAHMGGLNICRFSRNGQKIVKKMASFRPKFIIKEDITATVGNKKRVAF